MDIGIYISNGDKEETPGKILEKQVVGVLPRPFLSVITSRTSDSEECFVQTFFFFLTEAARPPRKRDSHSHGRPRSHSTAARTEFTQQRRA